MRHQLPASAALLAILAAPGWAKDRPLTDDEKVKLVAAVAAQGLAPAARTWSSTTVTTRSIT